MKLLCVIPSYWPAFHFGGPIYSVHAINKALVKKGVRVTVYTTSAGISEKICLNEEIDVDGIKVTYFFHNKLFDFLGATGWHFSLELTRSLRDNIASFDIVYIVALWNYTTTVATYYSRKNHKPYVISPRGALYPYTLQKKSWKKWPYYKLLTEKDLQNASAIHYTTLIEKEMCHNKSLKNSKAIVLPNGIDLSDYDNHIDSNKLKERYPALNNKKIILFLGRLHWIKGLDILLEAFSWLARKRSDVHLLLVGKDEDGYEHKIRAQLKKYGIDDSVTFTGILNGKEKMEVLFGSDIFVLPSYSENFGMSVIEAMAAGVPILISNKVGIHREIMENNAGHIVKTTSESIYDGLVHMINDNSYRDILSTNGKKMVYNYYEIENIANDMINAFEVIINNA